jgi:hypothetical protein
MSEDQSPEKRAADFRRRATEIRAMVKDFITAEAREGLLRIATDWERLADTAEREPKPQG